MKKLYEELMERVEVTDEMKTRILCHIRTEALEGPPPRSAMPLRRYKRLATMAACFAILAAGIWGAREMAAPVAEVPPISGVQVVPDIVKADSAEELSELVGFDVADVRGLPFEPTEAAYTAYWGETAEIQYQSADGEATFRKSAGTGDVSGDFNLYDTVQDLTIGDITATLKGNLGRYTLAVWSRDGFSYSLSIPSGAAEEIWSRIVAQTE